MVHDMYLVEVKKPDAHPTSLNMVYIRRYRPIHKTKLR